jgi:hypothetical protein
MASGLGNVKLVDKRQKGHQGFTFTLTTNPITQTAASPIPCPKPPGTAHESPP